MGYFSDSRRNWAGAFWAATAIPLVLDPSNPIWDESGWWEEQFGAPFAPLGPSGGNDYFTPNFWAGRGSETVGRRGPGTSPKVSPIIRGTCSAQSSKLILPKMLPWTPPLRKRNFELGLRSRWKPVLLRRANTVVAGTYPGKWSELTCMQESFFYIIVAWWRAL